jgi:PAS domain S-box-containing protein
MVYFPVLPRFAAMTSKPTYKELEQIVRRLEAQVARSEKLRSKQLSTTWLLNALLDNLNVGVFMVEAPSGKPILVNNYATHLLGRGILNGAVRTSLAEAYKAYKPGTDAFYPEDEMPIIRGLKGEYTSADDMEVVHPDGSKVLLEVFGCPVKDDQGQVIASLATFSDITKRKEAEEALRASEERYASIIAASRDGIFDWDIPGGHIFTSQRYQEIHGIGPSEMKNYNDWEQLLHPADRERIIEELQSQLKQETSVSDKEYRIIDPRGNEKWVWSRSMATFDEKGRPKRLFGSVSDITERKLAEKAHEKLQHQLIQAQKMESVGRLAGGVAHDFNNMLGVIIGNADLAIQNLDPSLQVHEDLQEIKAAAKRSADLTRQLLAFARRQAAAPIVLDLNETVEGMLKMLRRLIGEDIELVWMPRANLWPVKIDPAQIDQVLANLCVNARDAIEGVGRITIETQNAVSDHVDGIDDPEFSPGDYVSLTFSDNGCGMDEATRVNIFEPFYTTKDVGEGTGLGLSTVYGIVKQNDGFISVDSQPGKGTVFKIYLPRTTEVETADRDKTAVPIAGGSETVLLVEDERAILRMGKTMLERFGYTVLPAHEPNEALMIVEQYDEKIDMVVTDVVMPEMDGKELKRRIEIHHPDIKVLFMSGYSADVIMHRGILQEDVNFLQKPFTVDVLVNKVREVLDQPV